MNHLTTLIAQADARSFFEWGRIQSNSDWVLPLACFALVVLFVRWTYRRDSVELSPWTSWLLTILRVAAFAGLLVIYLKPQWRTEVFEQETGQVLLLVDTSLSMSLVDDRGSPGAEEDSRAEQITNLLADSPWLSELRARHDVVLVSFAEDARTLATFDKISPDSENATGEPQQGSSAGGPSSEEFDWTEALSPTGTETRLAAAVRQMITEHRSAPLAGVIVLTDGGQNAGPDTSSAVALAQQAGLPVHTVGVGSNRQPVNARVSDLVAPVRAQPGDAYTVTAYVQGQGLAGLDLPVELISRSADDEGTAAETVEARERITLGDNGEVVPIKFELTPEATGRRTLTFRILPPETDLNPDDNQQEVDIEIIDRKARVLLWASGPSREYQFLRNQLHRDDTVIVDVYLQSGTAGISQDANVILAEFPSTKEQLYEYDSIIAFDPHWHALSTDELSLLEDWVAREAGGLVLIAGPIHTQALAQTAELSIARSLYPVEFERRFAMLDDGRFGSKDPWQLDFTRDGLEAQFLWLADSATESRSWWEQFPGVYGYFDVKGAKPAATVYATFSDPRAAAGGDAPPYMASQFYGAGRVFYIGSGEMWRLRGVDPALFEAYYTKLIRYVSQGRLLRGSSRGTLLVERDRYVVGQTVVVRAQLTDAQREPLELPSVSLQVVHPDRTVTTLPLVADSTQVGTFSGQFTARQEGTYRFDLPVPDSTDDVLSRRIQVQVPDLERQDVRRNDALLAEMATATGGLYYIGPQAVLGTAELPPVAEQLRDTTRTKVVSDRPRPLWNNYYLLAFICGALSLEWLIRRIKRLA